MGGDIGDVIESFEGPRTLRYFTMLLILVVGVLVIGAVLSSLYGIHWIEETGMALASSPDALLNFAGFLALLALVITVVPTVVKYVD